MTLETVFLDAGGVLVHPAWNRVAAALWARGVRADVDRWRAAELRVARALDEEDVIARTDDASRWTAFLDAVRRGSGDVFPDDVWRDVVAEMAAYHRSDNLWEDVPDDVPAALGRLRAAGLRLVVVSNANGTVRRKLERVGLGAFLDDVVDSGDVGVEKPDARIFRIALERAGARAEATVHVGDFFHIDVVGARAAGVRAVLVDKAGLHADRDVDRVASLTELADLLLGGRSG